MSFLPGMMPLGAVGRATLPPMLSIAQVGSATSTGTTITAPADINAGDILVLLDQGGSSISAGAAATVVPAGFKAVSNLSSLLTIRQILSVKIATGEEAGQPLTGMAAPAFLGFVRKALYVFRGDRPAVKLDIKGMRGELTSNDVTPQLQAVSGLEAPVVVIGGFGRPSGALDPRSWSPGPKGGEISPNTSLYLAYQIFNGAPADTTIDMDDEGSDNCLQSFHLIPRKARPKPLARIDTDGVMEDGASIDVPDDVLPGDALVFFDYAVNNSTTVPGQVAPPGFSLIGGSSAIGGGRAMRLSMYAGLYTGQATITGMTATDAAKALMWVRSEEGPITAVSRFGSGAFPSGSDSAPTAANIAAAGAVPPAVTFAGFGSMTGSGISTDDLAPDLSGGVGLSTGTIALSVNWMEWPLDGETPVNMTASMGDEGSMNVTGGATLVFSGG